MPKLDDAFSFGSKGDSRARSRPAFFSLAAVALAAIAFLAWKTLGSSDGTTAGGAAEVIAGSQDLRVPANGDAMAEFLADGRPVFVVHHEDATVSVIDGLSSHTPFGVGKLVGWCDATRTFDDLQHGAKFDELGRYILGPAPTGLVTFATTDLGVTPAKVRVGAQQLPAPRSDVGGPISGQPCASTTDALLHRIGSAELTASPRDAVSGAPGRWMAVQGILLVTQDQAPRLCASVDLSAGPSCDLGAPVSGVDGAGLLGEESTYASDVATWLVRSDGTQLTDLTLVTGGQAI